MTTKVVKGTVWTLVGLMVPICFSLFATPIVTRLLGAESYGLFVLVLLIPAYFSFADFGMNIASTRFGSEAYAKGSAEKEARIVRTAALISFLSTLPFAAGMILFSQNILEAFDLPVNLIGEGSLSLKIASVTYVINFLSSTFNTPQLTRLRMDLNISITSGVRMAGIIATPLVVYLGGGVVGAVIVALIVSVATLAGHLFFSVRLLPELVGLSIDRASVKPMMKFGGSLVVAGIAAVLLANLEKFVLTKATSVEVLAYYSVAATLAAMLTLFSGSIAQSLMPAFSQLQGEANRSALSTLYSRGIRLTLIWLIPAVVFMVLVGRTFFTFWFSPDFGRESTGPYYIVIAGFFFNVLAYFPYAAIMSAGRSDIFAKIYWIELIPYVLIVWILAHQFGAKGAAAAWSLRVFFDAIILFWLARKVGGVKCIDHRLTFITLGSLVMAVPIFALVYYGTLNLEVLVVASLSGSIYFCIVWKRVLETAEVAWLARTIGDKLSHFKR